MAVIGQTDTNHLWHVTDHTHLVACAYNGDREGGPYLIPLWSCTVSYGMMNR